MPDSLPLRMKAGIGHVQRPGVGSFSPRGQTFRARRLCLFSLLALELQRVPGIGLPGEGNVLADAEVVGRPGANLQFLRVSHQNQRVALADHAHIGKPPVLQGSRDIGLNRVIVQVGLSEPRLAASTAGDGRDFQQHAVPIGFFAGRAPRSIGFLPYWAKPTLKSLCRPRGFSAADQARPWLFPAWWPSQSGRDNAKARSTSAGPCCCRT